MLSAAHAGQSVLVTGAGGCIGSALVQAIAAAGPSRVVLLDSSEDKTWLERNPIAAVGSNTIGTYTLTQAALRHGTHRLILISTDKAVNPHSGMGASKRLAELAAVFAQQCRDQ